MALVYSTKNMLPVRVVRGATHTSPFSPKAGYRYNGLYVVTDYWQEKGKAGYMVWRYRLVKEDSSTAPWHSTTSIQTGVSVGEKAEQAPKFAPKLVSPKPHTNLAASPRQSHELQKPAPPQFQVGNHVQHPIFGEGQVLEVAPSGQDQIVTVQFRTLGKKRLMAKAAKLEPLPRSPES